MLMAIAGLRDMSKHARDSAHLHEMHGGEDSEVEHWTLLADLWEARADELSRFRETTQNVLSAYDG